MMKKNKKAVVLGGGGHFGIAWELGYLRGLEEGGLPIREADIFVGTSAGSQASVIVTSDKDCPCTGAHKVCVSNGPLFPVLSLLLIKIGT